MTLKDITAHDPDVITKSEFARRRCVVPGRVTQWISEGAICGDALIGQGREQRIRETAAVEQLRRRLDASQRLGNGSKTNLSLVADQSAAPPPAEQVPESSAVQPSAASPPATRDIIGDRIREAKLEQIERDNRLRAEEEAARQGRYVLATEVSATMVKLVRELFVTFEGALPEFATAVAAKFSIPERDVLHLLRTELRPVRARIAVAAKKRIAGLPEFVDEPVSAGEAAAMTPAAQT